MTTPVSNITHGIKVSIVTEYLQDESIPEENYYLFAYHITIDNNSDDTVQLLTRHWDIFDSAYEHRQVDGEGVVGEQPIIKPGKHFEYESTCALRSEIGKMKGYYILERSSDNKEFKVILPEFELISPQRLN